MHVKLAAIDSSKFLKLDQCNNVIRLMSGGELTPSILSLINIKRRAANLSELQSMRESDHQHVRDLDLFSGMTAENFDELMEASFLQRFPPGVQLITQGDACDFLHVLVEGRVELYAVSNDRQATIAFVEPVATFILAAVIKDGVYLMSARTLAASRILMIPSPSIRTIFGRDQVFARAVVTELATAYRALVRRLKDQKLRTGTERLANCLLRLRREHGNAKAFSLPVEKRILASLLGMTPENLSRAFAALAPHGVIVDGATIAIGSPDALEQFAHPNPLIDDVEH